MTKKLFFSERTLTQIFVAVILLSATLSVIAEKPIIYHADGRMAGERFWGERENVALPKSFFVIPRQLPGPLDAWAGGKSHSFSIPLTIRGHLRIVISDSHEKAPPTIEIELNGKPLTTLAIKPGRGAPEEKWSEGKTHVEEIDVPTGGLLTLKSISGSWVAFDRIDVIPRYTFPLVKANAFLWVVLLVLRTLRYGPRLARVIRYPSPHIVDYSLLFLVTLYLLTPLWEPGYFFSHEEIFPYYRLIGLRQAVRSGQFPPQVLPNLANGFGYGWNLFYPPLAYLFTWLVSLPSTSLTATLKIVHFFSFFMSSFFMYRFMERVSKKRIVAFAAAFLYLTAPYRLVDLFVRNAYAESFGFIFLPLLFWGLYEIGWGDKGKAWLFALGAAGMALTHNISALYLFFFGALFCIATFGRIGWAGLRLIVGQSLLALLLASFFLLPLMEQKLTGAYAAFDGFSPTGATVADGALYPRQLFRYEFILGASLPLAAGTENEMPFPIGIPLALVALMALYRRCKDGGTSFVGPLLPLGVLAAFMTTLYFPWKWAPALFCYVQFPWRLLLFASFFLAAYGATAFDLPREYEKRGVILLTVVMAATLVYVAPMLKTIPLSDLDESTIGPTELNAGFVIGTSSGEYLPTRLYTNRDYFHQRGPEAIVMEGEARTDLSMSSGSNHLYRFIVGEEGATIELPLIYYSGYEARVIGPGGMEGKVAVTESTNGFCAITIPGGAPNERVEVRVSYAKSPATQMGLFLTLVGLVTLVWQTGWRRRSSPPVTT